MYSEVHHQISLAEASLQQLDLALDKNLGLLYQTVKKIKDYEAKSIKQPEATKTNEGQIFHRDCLGTQRSRLLTKRMAAERRLNALKSVWKNRAAVGSQIPILKKATTTDLQIKQKRHKSIKSKNRKEAAIIEKVLWTGEKIAAKDTGKLGKSEYRDEVAEIRLDAQRREEESDDSDEGSDASVEIITE
jgi:hypothetical protein